MTKLKVYIDFEAISSPFNRDINVKMDFPYAYTVGIYVGNQFKTSTYIFNFQKESVDNIDQTLRINILRDVRKLLSKNDFNINATTTEFVSYNLGLERKILSNVYKGVKLTDISKGTMISLAAATNKYIESRSYFSYLKEWVNSNLDADFIKKRGLSHDGALAALGGYILYCNALKSNGKFYNDNIDIKVLVKELVDYSGDDVVRMKYINENLSEFLKDASEWKVIVNKKNKIKYTINKEKTILEYLKQQDHGLEIGKVIENLENNITKLTNEIDELKIK